MRLNSSTMTRRPRISGFTLVELLVVMVVIVFLMGLIFGGIKSAMHIAACAHAKQDVKSLVGAIDAYRAEYGTFPASIIDATVNTSTNFGLLLKGFWLHPNLGSPNPLRTPDHLSRRAA